MNIAKKAFLATGTFPKDQLFTFAIQVKNLVKESGFWQ